LDILHFTFFPFAKRRVQSAERKTPEAERIFRFSIHYHPHLQIIYQQFFVQNLNNDYIVVVNKIKY